MRNAMIVAALVAILGSPAGALAQGDAPAQPATPAAQPDAPAQADVTAQLDAPAQADVSAQAAATPAAAPADPGALRATCEQALRADAAWRADLKAQLANSILKDAPDPADAKWRAELKEQLRSEVHTEDARLMLNNNKHVVMAYAVLWILVLAFLVYMWMKQQALKAEIARLERDIRQATKEAS